MSWAQFGHTAEFRVAQGESSKASHPAVALVGDTSAAYMVNWMANSQEFTVRFDSQQVCTGGRVGLGPTLLPAAFLAQYPGPGSGTKSFLHILASPTSEIPNSFATFWTG